MKLETVKIAALVPDPANARTHDARNLDAIAKSLETFGQRKPIVVQSTDLGLVVLAGNGTVEAAKRLGWSEISATRVPSDWSWDQARAYALADNRTAELAAWDETILAGQLIELDANGWELSDLGFESLQPPAESGVEILPDVNDVPPPPVNPTTRAGDLWILGSHRLLCGDSRNADDVAYLLNGASVNLAFTSPPYAEQRTYDESSGFKPIPPDAYVEWFAAVAENVKRNLAADGSWFVNIKPASAGLDTELYVFDLVLSHVREWGWHFATEFCWERSGVPKQVTQRFKNQFEPVYQFALGRWKMRPDAVRHVSTSVPKAGGKGVGETNWKDAQGNRDIFGGRGAEPGLAYPGNRLPTFSSSHEMVGHTAAFPVGLPEFFIKAYTDAGDNVYDPFMGSGSTMLAAEQQGRVAFGMEISPAYCDVIVQRWERVTGRTAERVTANASAD